MIESNLSKFLENSLELTKTCKSTLCFVDGTGTQIACDLTSMAFYIAQLVTFSYPWSADTRLPNTSYERVINATQVNFYVDSVPESNKSNGMICCRLRKNMLTDVTVGMRERSSNCQVLFVGCKYTRMLSL